MSPIKILSLTAMKQTKDKVFIDTNIIIYAHTDLDAQKRATAQQLLSSHETVTHISTQVLQETSNTLSKKFKHTWGDITRVIEQLKTYNVVYTNGIGTVDRALMVASQYGYSFYDSLIIASAQECSCGIVYSEDMRSGHKIGDMVILNPFEKN